MRKFFLQAIDDSTLLNNLAEDDRPNDPENLMAMNIQLNVPGAAAQVKKKRTQKRKATFLTFKHPIRCIKRILRVTPLTRL